MYVKPYVKRGKSDAIDAEAVCKAVKRPTMRFVAIKTVGQQALLSLHRARSLLVRQRTQLINGLRGMAAEFGVYIAKGLARVIEFAEDILAGEVYCQHWGWSSVQQWTGICSMAGSDACEQVQRRQREARANYKDG